MQAPNVAGPQQESSYPAWYGYATFGSRAAALLIDYVIVMGITLVTGAIAVGVAVAVGALTGSDGVAVAVGVLLGVPAYIALLIAYMFMDGRPYGQTPGKNIMGIRVVGRTGAPVSRGTAVGRYFAEALSGMTMYIGYLMVLWDDQNRALHDMLVSTWVINSGPDKPPLKAVLKAPFSRSGNTASQP